jgi:hypothetical protein
MQRNAKIGNMNKIGKKKCQTMNEEEKKTLKHDFK